MLLVFFSKGRRLDWTYWESFFGLFPHIPTILLDGLGLHLLQLGALWFLFTCAGSIVAQRLRLTALTKIEHLLVCAGLGAGATSLLLLFLGLAGFWQPQILRRFLYVGLAISVGLMCLKLWTHRHGEGRDSSCQAPVPMQQERPGFLEGAALCLIFLAIIMNVMAASVPETFHDALVYHLGLPKLYLLRGAIVPTPENIFSGIPFGVQMLYGLALALADAHLASLLHCSFGVLTATAIWAILRRYASNSAGLFGALLFYLCPLVLYGSWQSGIDAAIGFYLILALIALSPGFQATGFAEMRPFIIAAGMLLGFAMSTKYTAVPMAGLFGLAFYWLRKRSGERDAAKAAAWMVVIACAVLMPWLIKNFLFYGNPFYPFFNTVIGSASPADWQSLKGEWTATSMTTLAGWQNILTQPWTTSLGSRMLDDWPGISFLLFIPWALYMRWNIFKKAGSVPAAWTAILLLGVGGYAIWCLTTGVARFLVFALPFLSCLPALSVVHGPVPLWLRRTAWSVALLSAAYSFQVTFRMGSDDASGRWAVISGRISPTDYLKSPHMAYPAPPYAAMEFIRSQLPQNAKVLFLGDSRAFYCERDFIAPTVYDYNPFWVAAGAARKPEELAASLKNLGITHLFVSANLLYRFSGQANMFPKEIIGGTVFGEFWARYLENIFEERTRSVKGTTTSWLVVYKLRDAPTRDSTKFPQNLPKEILQEIRSRDLKMSVLQIQRRPTFA